MENLSLREAVKLFDVSRPTLTKAINSGKLSGVRNDKGQWEISPSELTRVYRPRVAEPANHSDQEQVKFTTSNTPANTDIARLKAELALAEARAEAAEKLAQERAERIDDLRRMLPPPITSAPRSLWPWKRRR